MEFKILLECLKSIRTQSLAHQNRKINPKFVITKTPSQINLVCEEIHLDEQWSFVGNKSIQRWIWYAIEYSTNTILAYIFGKRKDIAFKELTLLSPPLKIKRYYTDN